MRVLPVASDAWRFVVPLTAVGVWFVWLNQWWSLPWGVLSLLAALFCLFFFRDFNRDTKEDKSAIYSPGDGTIMETATLSDGEYKGSKIIRIFLSVLDGHVQRSPVEGNVESVQHKPGTFLDARHNRAHLDNEQTTMVVSTPRGKIVVKQIAGLIARRIVCWVKQGDTLKQGQRYGLIRFGSQVDVFMPADMRIEVKPGERVVGGLTVIARWPS